ncbi:hypothetical protein J6590_000902 [Homalodisca vitripennis]|nr:hypothetical protein J6590_000902 [Homalodisca vitripennis]
MELKLVTFRRNRTYDKSSRNIVYNAIHDQTLELSLAGHSSSTPYSVDWFQLSTSVRRQESSAGSVLQDFSQFCMVSFFGDSKFLSVLQRFRQPLIIEIFYRSSDLSGITQAAIWSEVENETVVNVVYIVRQANTVVGLNAVYGISFFILEEIIILVSNDFEFGGSH